jgi:TolB-like protein/Tfp pilus assembly protein PilF
MPSLLATFSYDIFISYRHNDNKSGWVTDFVNALQEELASTIKEPLSVYFDRNPHDGLLETHSVDKSLEGKLKCLIFIPIISQTYCDPKSFAWQHEFVAFNKFSKEDPLGRDIKLGNGNVTSRILPVKIHDLDATDKLLLENELGGALRAIEFIYREPGVNRPLKATDSKADNQNKTDYRNQVNKVANAIKELIVAMQSGGTTIIEKPTVKKQNVTVPSRKKISMIAFIVVVLGLAAYSLYYFTDLKNKFFVEPDKSIAVLPFDNMSKDPEQDYFSDGIAEDILNHLVKIADLKVKSRTSTLPYKDNKTKSVTEIGEELKVGNIVEGSVRRVGDKVRIVVQLIDTKTDTHLWSETYDRDLKDVLSLQSEIAIEIAHALEAQLSPSEKKNIQKDRTQNVTAYDYFLKAKEFQRRGSLKKADLETALQLANKAIQSDKGFSRAYALKAQLWFDLSYYGIAEKIWYDSVMYNADQAIHFDPASADGYLVKASVLFYLGKVKQAIADIKKVYGMAPNNPDVLGNYGSVLLDEGREEGADLILKSAENQYSSKEPEYYNSYIGAYFRAEDWDMVNQLSTQAKSLNPDGLNSYFNLAIAYTQQGKYDKAIEEMLAAEKINPNHSGVIDRLAWTYFRKKDFVSAAKYWGKYPEIEKRFSDSTQTVPFRHRLAMTYAKLGKRKEGEKLVREDLQIQTELLTKKRGMGAWANFGSIYYDMAVDHAFLGNDQLAVQCLDSAWSYKFYYFEGYGNDPIFAPLRDREDFKSVAKKKDDKYQFLNKAFTNALNRSKASKELKGLLEK